MNPSATCRPCTHSSAGMRHLVGELLNPLEVLHHVVNSGGAGDMECSGETWSWSRSPREGRALAEGSGTN